MGPWMRWFPCTEYTAQASPGFPFMARQMMPNQISFIANAAAAAASVFWLC
jgi:hypothetical protein